ncbi:hypothetical protein [Kineococcus esterisolvens]|uniref:hypothetical protein n=1 Tax=Kineococcus sp. SYSU DK008 TaxID=3383129 RepID=UPI003D7D63DF
MLQLLASPADAAGEHWLDPMAAPEGVLSGDRDRAAAALEQWRDAPRDQDPREVLQRVTGRTAEPSEGVSWSSRAAWFEGWLEAQVRVGVRRGVRLVMEVLAQHRTGSFDPRVDLDAVVDEVLTQRSSAVGSWLGEVGGSQRLEVVAELAEPVRTVLLAAPTTVVGTRRTALVLQRGADRRPAVLDVHPELPPARPARRRPRTSALLGAYLGPALERLEAQPWSARRALLAQEPEHVIGDLVRDLDDLTRLGDDDLHAAVAAAGGAVLPADLRGWLQRLVWRWRSFPRAAEG